MTSPLPLGVGSHARSPRVNGGRAGGTRTTWIPDLYLTTRPSRGMALVRGPWAERVTRSIPRRYSQTARGWVIALDAVEDVRAYAQADRLRLVEKAHS